MAAVKWHKHKHDWGAKHISPDTLMFIEDHNNGSIRVWFDPLLRVDDPVPFDTVRAAKKYVNTRVAKEAM